MLTTILMLSIPYRTVFYHCIIQVEMTTGATIHTTEGLEMTVTRRTIPPIIPNLETKELTFDDNQQLNSNLLEATSATSSVPEEDQQGEVSAIPVS